MKYRFVFILIITGIFPFSATYSQEKNFIIRGKIENLHLPAKAYLSYSYENEYFLDSCEIKNGKFAFHGKIDYPLPAKIMLDHEDRQKQHGKDVMNFYMEPGEMVIRGKEFIKTASVSGSKTQELDMAFQKQLEYIKRKADNIQEAFIKASPELQNNEIFRDSLDKEFYDLVKQYNDTAIDFIETHPEEMLGLYMLRSELTIHPDNERAWLAYERLDKSIKNTAPGKEVSEMIEKSRRVSVGASVPELCLTDLQGDISALSDLEGKYVLLFFWSPECNHCEKEIPYLNYIHSLYKDKNLAMIGIAIESERRRADWEQLIKANQMEWPQVSDLKLWESELAKAFNIKNVPYVYLTDPQGKIIAKEIYREQLLSKIESLFALE
ncbi:MAG: AhpC/TSA family protein [Candidatus Azobacteroides sp.]|nr:AhpC/TSA family protein [Candidatus Azobacteroides sp.]